MIHEQDLHSNSPQQSKAKWVFFSFSLIAGFFLITEHRAHLFGWLSAYGIWLLLLACPLMHIFMHRDHGGHSDHSSGKDDSGERK